MAVNAEAVDLVVEKRFVAIQRILDYVDCSQPHYFFIILWPICGDKERLYHGFNSQP